jgi:hypothetical protein
MLKVEGERGQEGGKGEGGVTVRAGRDGIFSSCLAHVIERDVWPMGAQTVTNMGDLAERGAKHVAYFSRAILSTEFSVRDPSP